MEEVDYEKLGYYPHDSILRKKLKSIIEIGSLVLVWYGAAVITITSSKEIMNRIRFPYFLCTIQFLFAAILTNLYMRYTGQDRIVPSHITSMIYRISASYTLGFILTNWAFSIGRVNLHCPCIF